MISVLKIANKQYKNSRSSLIIWIVLFLSIGILSTPQVEAEPVASKADWAEAVEFFPSTLKSGMRSATISHDGRQVVALESHECDPQSNPDWRKAAHYQISLFDKTSKLKRKLFVYKFSDIIEKMAL